MYQKAAFRVMAREMNQEIPKETDRGEKDSEEYLFRFVEKLMNSKDSSKNQQWYCNWTKWSLIRSVIITSGKPIFYERGAQIRFVFTSNDCRQN